MNKQVDVLIQNVSSQCIPNLVAAQTYKPKSIIWIYTPETKKLLKYLKQSTQKITSHQMEWQVNARHAEAMESVLKEKFAQLQVDGLVLFHMTGGTKSMALQGLAQLVLYHNRTKKPISAVVMDPHTQHFDVLFPQAINNAIDCSCLSLTEILKVHGSWRQADSGRDMQSLRKIDEPLNALRALHKPLMEAVNGRTICSKDEATDGYFFLYGGDDLPKVVQEGLWLAQDAGAIEQLKIEGAYFSFQPACCHDPLAYCRNMWMEDWIACVLAKHDDGQWRGGFSSVKVNIKEKNDCQEFDFLGARKNHLVYWSCKNTQTVTSAQLFEIDALRDEVAGRDFHVAGLLHTAKVEHGLQRKAQRLGIQLVRVTDRDAEEKLCQISCR